MSTASEQGGESSSLAPDPTTAEMPVIQKPSAGWSIWQKMAVAIFVLILALVPAAYFLTKDNEKEGERQAAAASVASCHLGWRENEGRCYLISETELTWNDSLQNCSSYNATLVQIDTQSELDFLINNNTLIYYWVNLKKETIEWLWNQSNGSRFLANFQNEGEDLCPYMNNKKLSKTRCASTQHWICSKPLLAS